MAQQVQELIDKIKTEGLEAAQAQAHQVEQQAQQKASQIIEEAEKKAKLIESEAELKAKKTQESTQTALKQAARDTLLSLRQEIQRVLKQLTKQNVGQALSAEQLAKILESLIQSLAQAGIEGKDIQITLSADDETAVKEGLLAQLQSKLKDEITLRSSDDVGKGFLISYDAGRSDFDFTDENLAEYLGGFLNNQVSNMVEEAVKTS